MRRIGAVLVVLILNGVSAQGQYKYELRNPTAEEFMQAVPAIVEQAYADGTDSTIRHVIGQEFDLRYGDEALTTMSFDLMLDFQTTLVIGADPSLPQDTERWLMASESFPPDTLRTKAAPSRSSWMGSLIFGDSSSMSNKAS